MRSCIGPGSCVRPGPWRSDVLVVMKRDATKDQIDGVVQRIGELIERLRNPDQEAQQRASSELWALKEKTYLLLLKASQSGDPQLRWRR